MPSQDRMYVCHCRVVTDRSIRDAIAGGAGDVCAVARLCGAGAGCGGCVPAIERLLAESARTDAGPPLRQAAGRRLAYSRPRAGSTVPA